MLLILLDRGRERLVCLQVVEGDAEGLLAASSEWGWETNTIVLSIAGEKCRSVISIYRMKICFNGQLQLDKPVGIIFNWLRDEWTSTGGLAVLYFKSSNASNLLRRERDIVFALRLLGNILDKNIDLLLGVVLLQGDDMDQVGVLEDLRRLELGWL